MANITLTAKQIAERLQRPVMWWYRHRQRLEGLGFPKPIAGFNNLWSAAAVNAWINGGTPANSNDGPASEEQNKADTKAKLRERAKAIAGRVAKQA